jgi:hypothetical protein
MMPTYVRIKIKHKGNKAHVSTIKLNPKASTPKLKCGVPESCAGCAAPPPRGHTSPAAIGSWPS